MTSFKLLGRIDRAAQVHEDDTLQTKGALKAFGDYRTPTYGMTPYPDEPMFEGIKAYQKANKLRVDGVMKPGGETEQSMNKRIAATNGAKSKKQCPVGFYPVNKRICIPGTGICKDNWVCEQLPRGGGKRG